MTDLFRKALGFLIRVGRTLLLIPVMILDAATSREYQTGNPTILLKEYWLMFKEIWA